MEERERGREREEGRGRKEERKRRRRLRRKSWRRIEGEATSSERKKRTSYLFVLTTVRFLTFFLLLLSFVACVMSSSLSLSHTHTHRERTPVHYPPLFILIFLLLLFISCFNHGSPRISASSLLHHFSITMRAAATAVASLKCPCIMEEEEEEDEGGLTQGCQFGFFSNKKVLIKSRKIEKVENRRFWSFFGLVSLLFGLGRIFSLPIWQS